MTLFEIILAVSTLLCSIVTGFLFAFAIVVMPGTRRLDDRGFLQAFKAMDRIIQNNHPLFILVWLGSAVSLIAATVMGFGQLESVPRSMLVAACGLYMLGVQVPTIVVNVPLNNRLQAQDLDTLGDAELATARADFEPRWVQWNTLRTVVATAVTAILILVISLA